MFLLLSWDGGWGRRIGWSWCWLTCVVLVLRMGRRARGEGVSELVERAESSSLPSRARAALGGRPAASPVDLRMGRRARLSTACFSRLPACFSRLFWRGSFSRRPKRARSFRVRKSGSGPGSARSGHSAFRFGVTHAQTARTSLFASRVTPTRAALALFLF